MVADLFNSYFIDTKSLHRVEWQSVTPLLILLLQTPSVKPLAWFNELKSDLEDIEKQENIIISEEKLVMKSIKKDTQLESTRS